MVAMALLIAKKYQAYFTDSIFLTAADFTFPAPTVSRLKKKSGRQITSLPVDIVNACFLMLIDLGSTLLSKHNTYLYTHLAWKAKRQCVVVAELNGLG
jgi:hypothetical protein